MKPSLKTISMFNRKFLELLEGFSSHHSRKLKSRIKKIRTKLERRNAPIV